MDGYLGSQDRQRIVDLYEDRFARLGRSHQTVGWGSVEDQRLRFEVLFRGLDPRGKTVLDVGCGLGDLIPYLDERFGRDYRYVGIDVSKKLIRDAAARFGAANRRFAVGDVQEIELSEPVEIAVLSGALNFRIADNWGYARAALMTLCATAREAVAVNFLSTYVDFQTEKNFHYSPEEMFRFAKSLTRNVALFHDYPLWEFTLQLKPDPR